MIGKTKDELNAFERTQAVLNDVLERHCAVRCALAEVDEQLNAHIVCLASALPLPQIPASTKYRRLHAPVALFI